MSRATLISPAAYLATVCRPDCDYIDGEVWERNAGERSHARLQALLVMTFGAFVAASNIVVLLEQRVQVSKTRFRVPDICIVRAGDPNEEIVRHPPLLCIEILSPEDTLMRLRDRIEDFLGMGVENIWVLDPVGRHAYIASEKGLLQPEGEELRIANTEIVIRPLDLFNQL